MSRLNLCGERLSITYQLLGTVDEAEVTAKEICVEQTIEYPFELVADDEIREQIVGSIDSIERIDERRCQANISYAVETAGNELNQLLNLAFGNISLKPGIRLTGLELPDRLLAHFRGPRFGRAGLRALLWAPDRPLLSTALKPMGLSPEALAEHAYDFALGGIDLIKDDHGIADQPFCRFQERVTLCAQAVDRANQKTGDHCIYLPNVTTRSEQLRDRLLFAKNAGARGLLVTPGLVGLDTMRSIADDDALGLPIMSHPALQGSLYVHPDSGISHYALFGQLLRLAGADVCIFPSYGGRFSFSQEECSQINEGTSVPMGNIAPILPAPAGGMSLERVPEMRGFYGDDVIFLIGGDLHRGPDLVNRCRRFRELVSTNE